METSSKFGIFLLVIYLSGIMCRSMPPVRHYTLDRLNIKRIELKQLCDAKGENFYEDIHSKHISFTLNLTERFMTWKKEVTPNDDVYKLVQERCNKDMTLKEMLKKFIESSQLCMDEKDRLKEDKLQALSSRLMELFCAQYTHSHAFSSDEGCLDLVTNAAIDTCKEKYKTDQFIPLPFLYSNKECNDYQKYSECRLEAMKSCKDATKTAVEAADSIMFHTFYGCHNISVIPEKITIKRSISNCNSILRFNISETNFKEKCNHNANVSFESIQKSLAMRLDQILQEEHKIMKMSKIIDNDEIQELDNRNLINFYSTPILREKLINIYETVELCIPENERFTPEQKIKILRESLVEIVLSARIGGKYLRGDNGCFQDMRRNKCDRHLSSENFIYSIPLPFITTPEYCDKMLKFKWCQLNGVKECKLSSIVLLERRIDEAMKFFGCINY